MLDTVLRVTYCETCCDSTIVIETTKPYIGVAAEDAPVNLFGISSTLRIDASCYQSCPEITRLSNGLESRERPAVNMTYLQVLGSESRRGMKADSTASTIASLASQRGQ